MIPAIIINNIYKTFALSNGNREFSTVLNQISFTVEQGKIIGVVGKNGSGKTTLLRILSGLTKPTNGTVSINGKLISIIELGSGFHPDLNGLENINYYAQILGFTQSQITPLTESIIAFSEIGNYVNEPVKTYSKGMFLRLAYSIVAHLDADIYLFDEVFAVGDSYFKEKCIKNLLELKAKGKTIIITGHDYELINSVCDDFIEIENGLISERKKDTGSITDAIDLDNDIQLSKIEFKETETEYVFDIELKHVEGYNTLDVMLIIDYNSNSAIRFVVDCQQQKQSLVIAHDNSIQATISINKKQFNIGSYTVSMGIIKNRKLISRNFPYCLTFHKKVNSSNDISNLYPGPIHIYGKINTLN